MSVKICVQFNHITLYVLSVLCEKLQLLHCATLAALFPSVFAEINFVFHYRYEKVLPDSMLSTSNEMTANMKK